MGAWIETVQAGKKYYNVYVAPHVGAWIETRWLRTTTNGGRSHPTWVRGLKPRTFAKQDMHVVSHPTWVRGLKHTVVPVCVSHSRVAPHVGAWIETLLPVVFFMMTVVAPHVGAWIETF